MTEDFFHKRQMALNPDQHKPAVDMADVSESDDGERERKSQEFLAKARAFYEDYKNGRGFEIVKRSGQKIEIGTGSHRGLIIGKPDLWLLGQVMENLRKLYQEEGIAPQHYVLKELGHCFVDRGVGVQEFVDSPTLNDLTNFLKGDFYLEEMNSQARKLCEAFLGTPKNRDLTLKKLKAADQELYEHSTQLSKYGRRTIFAQRNVLVLGQEDKKIIFAPIDVE
ncbi:MAG: hypothetical protein WC551_02030 [Patescibacteria group bacterium]